MSKILYAMLVVFILFCINGCAEQNSNNISATGPFALGMIDGDIYLLDSKTGKVFILETDESIFDDPKDLSKFSINPIPLNFQQNQSNSTCNKLSSKELKRLEILYINNSLSPEKDKGNGALDKEEREELTLLRKQLSCILE